MPYYKRGLDWVHQHTRMKVFMHNDGAIFDFIPTLIEMGVDILNPVQTTAKGMDPVKLKQQFGDRLVFWGGACDCQDTLAFGTPEQVAREVAREHPHLRARRRLRAGLGPQHPGQRPAGERDRAVRRGEGEGHVTGAFPRRMEHCSVLSGTEQCSILRGRVS